MALRRVKDSEARRRKPPSKAKSKWPGGQAEIALARNVAELEVRVQKVTKTAVRLKVMLGHILAQKEMLMKVAAELAETDTFDIAVFNELLQKELEDVGVAEPEEDNGEELE